MTARGCAEEGASQVGPSGSLRGESRGDEFSEQRGRILRAEGMLSKQARCRGPERLGEGRQREEVGIRGVSSDQKGDWGSAGPSGGEDCTPNIRSVSGSILCLS